MTMTTIASASPTFPKAKVTEYIKQLNAALATAAASQYKKPVLTLYLNIIKVPKNNKQCLCLSDRKNSRYLPKYN